MTTEITSNSRYLLVRTNFLDKDLVKAIPTARWVPTDRVWRIDATPALAAQLRDALPAARWAEDARQVLDAHSAVVVAQAVRDLDQIDVPHLKTRPWRHQRQAYAFAATMAGHINSMVMGTGKSLPMVALAAGQRRTLVLCPARVVSVWPRQFRLHCDRPVTVWADDKGDTSRKAARLKGAMALAEARQEPFVAVLNYEACWRGWDGQRVAVESMAATLLGVEWDLVVLDESHRIKSASGRASKFARKLAPHAAKRVCLSGTPTPHNPLDIWAQMDFAARGVLHPSWVTFRNQYEIHPPARRGQPDWVAKQILGYRDLDKLAALTAPYIYRVGAEVLDLPEAVHTTEICHLEPNARQVYAQLEKQSIAAVQDGQVTALNALAKITRLQQVTGGALPTDGEGAAYDRLKVVSTAKQRLLQDILEDIAPDEAVVVFCRFRHDLDAVHAAAGEQGRRSYELSGRQDDLATWQDPATPPGVLAVQVQAGGVGVDLTRARYSIFYSLSYSLGEYDQALARCHRPGQTRSVHHIHLVAAGTIDEAIREALEKRREVVEFVYQQWCTGGSPRKASTGPGDEPAG